MDFIVFNLTNLQGNRVLPDTVLRYAYDSRCEVESGDVWTRWTISDVASYRVFEIRDFVIGRVKERHVYLMPHPQAARFVH